MNYKIKIEINGKPKNIINQIKNLNINNLDLNFKQSFNILFNSNDLVTIKISVKILDNYSYNYNSILLKTISNNINSIKNNILKKNYYNNSYINIIKLYNNDIIIL